ncbi:MAG: hypothetical protein OEZ43_07740 [Gammaproteobacteria bacterium]|nr:hypothetical protein [Gammaproteobacteria bacterium]
MADFDPSFFSIKQNSFKWLPDAKDLLVLNAGELTKKIVKVPRRDAQRIVDSVVRFVLDLPRNSTPLVVWTHGDSELLLHSDKTRIDLSSGIVTITATVECDQSGVVEIPIPLGVGSSSSPSGLLMSAFNELQGPRAIVDIWTDSLTAFAWETLLETAKAICSQFGVDTKGRPLVPGSIGAGSQILLIQPIARHSLRVEA